MALTHTIESLDNVQEELHSHYVEADGKFILQIDEIVTHPDVLSLSNALGRTKTKMETQGAELKSALSNLSEAKKLVENLPEDFDLDIWTAAKDKKPDAAISTLQEKMKALSIKYEGEKDSLKAENTKLVDAGKRSKIERQLDDLIEASGVNVPSFKRAVRAEVLGKIAIDDAGKATVDTDDLGEMSLGDYLKRFLATDGKDFVSPPKGGGASGNDRGTGGTGKTLTRTEFEALNTVQRAKAMKEGVTLTS